MLLPQNARFSSNLLGYSSDLGIWYTKTTYGSVRLYVMASHSDVFLPPSNKRQCISVCHRFKLYPYDHINNYFSAQSGTRIVWSGTVDTQKQPTAHLFEQSCCWFVVFPPCNKRQYVSVWTHTQLRNGTISSGGAWSSEYEHINNYITARQLVVVPDHQWIHIYVTYYNI